LGLGYIAAAILHFARPQAMIRITPDWVPHAELVVALSGIAEAVGALALLQPWSRRLRRAAGIALALYALCVFPANINHMLIDMARAEPELGLAYHGPRMLLQPVLIWLALWVSKEPNPHAHGPAALHQRA
jgi:uncharacterized membrane protein